MKFAEIRAMPQTLREIPAGSSGVHESTLRAYHILNKVRELLILETPPTVLLDIIEDLHAGDRGIPIVGEAR